MVRSRHDGLPVYGYRPMPGVAAAGALELAGIPDAGGVPPARAHAHDFFVVVYFERDGGALRIGSSDWPIAGGHVCLITPGDVVALTGDAGLAGVRGRAVWFSPEALGLAPADSLLSWRAHPLLFPFADHAGPEPKRWGIPAGDRAGWSARMRAIDRELHERRPGHRDAVGAHLTLLLLDVARLARPSAAHPDRTPEPLVAEVLAYVDQRYRDPISLTDVARAVSMSPGHLTTVVGRRTGRTVHAWITERRLAEARRLLVDTRLTVHQVGRLAGYRDPSYFARLFRKHHGTTPLGWRRARHITS